MTHVHMNEYRIALQKKQAELIYRHRGRAVLAIEATADEMDQTQVAQERELAIGTFARDAKLLQDVRSALVRMEVGTFGICLDCEYHIHEKRLSALPWAALCIVCQDAADSVASNPLASAA